ncbi:hypothetical protein HN51_006777 [Arachis hypogaea]
MLNTGILLCGNPRSISFWDPVVEEISKCLAIWKGAYFSLGGHIILIHACLSGSPLYFFFLFRIPVGVLETSDLWLTTQKSGNQLERYHKASSLIFAIQIANSVVFLHFGLQSLSLVMLSPSIFNWIRIQK